jgi:hypothetical protein
MRRVSSSSLQGALPGARSRRSTSCLRFALLRNSHLVIALCQRNVSEAINFLRTKSYECDAEQDQHGPD